MTRHTQAAWVTRSYRIFFDPDEITAAVAQHNGPTDEIVEKFVSLAVSFAEMGESKVPVDELSDDRGFTIQSDVVSIHFEPRIDDESIVLMGPEEVPDAT